MSLWGTFTNSVNAMNAQATSLSVISQNIANVNTTGYKGSDTQFQTMLSDVTQPASIFSVQATPRQLIDVQGVIAPSANANDLAINGKGFFMVNSAMDGSGSMAFTRDGAFNQAVGSSASSVSSSSTSSPGAGQTSYMTDANGNYLMGWMATDGKVTTADSTKGLTAVGYQMGQLLPGTPTTTVALQGTVPSNPGVDAQGNSLEQTTSIPVYDNKDNVQSLNLNFTQSGADNWKVGFSMDPSVGTVTSTTSTATFDGSGNLVTPAAPMVANVAWADGSTSSISVDISKMNQLASTQIQVDHTTQDGTASGNLASVNFNSQGQLIGNYTNGQTQMIAQLPIATFVSPNNLAEASGTEFTQTAAAGAMTVNTVQQLGSQTSVSPGSVEMSNVDLGNQFTDMVVTQKAYNSASKVFQTADEMTTTVRDLIV